ncbi:MAG TPA: hypothetical protein VH481_06465 [Nitrososphaeraceae archaeon]
MNIIKPHKPASTLIVVTLVAIFFSSFTLWLVEAWIRYPLFIYEIFAIVLIYLFLEKDSPINYCYLVSKLTKIGKRIIETHVVSKIPRRFISDLLLIGFSSILVILNEINIEGGTGGYLQLILAFLCASFFSGYALLNIFNVKKMLSRLEVFALSFLLSFIFSGFVTLGSLLVEEHTRSIVIPILYMIIGIVSIVLSTARRGDFINQKQGSFSRNIDFFAVLLSVAFYILFFYSTYPNFSLLAGSDIARHYSSSIILSRTPDLYTQFSYLLFHAFYASIYSLSGFQQSVISIQSILVILNIFLPILVYALAKRFLGNVDRRIPALSTIFYSILTNLSFIYFAQLKLMNTGSSEIQMLEGQAAEKAFNGTINFLQPFPWFAPLSVSFMLFMMAFILLKVQNIPKAKFVTLFSILIVAMYLTHVTEAIAFVIFIALYSFISKSASLRLNDVLISSFVAFLAIAAFFGYRSFFWVSDLSSVNIDPKAVLSIFLPMLLVGISILWRAKILPKMRFHTRFGIGEKFYSALSLALIAAYLFGFFAWFFSEDFRTSSVYNIGAVPWFIYPLMLGIVGLLAILSVRYLSEYMPNSSISIILAAIIIMFLFGRVVSFLNFNLNYIASGYWEKRFLVFLFLFLSLLAPISLIKFREQVVLLEVNRKNRQFIGSAFLASIVGLIVVSGFCSTALQSEYWVDTVYSKRISDKELHALSYLREILSHDSHAFTISLSKYSKDVLAFAAPVYQYPLSSVFGSSKYPDIPLYAMASHNLKHAYIYMHTRDFQALNSEKQSWFDKHLISMLPIIFSNEEVTIYNATRASFPLPSSETHLVIPANPFFVPQTTWFYAYDVLSQSNKNYTVDYDTDPNALKAKTVILSFDPTESHIFYQRFSNNSTNNGWFIGSGSNNWNYSSEGLHGGGKSSTLLSPISSKDSVISTSFRITDISPKDANYVSIVHSWIDNKNYKYTGIMVFKNSIYVDFATVTNGKLSYLPKWPGIKTDFHWKPGTLFNLKVIDHSNINEVEFTLNGTRYVGHSLASDIHNPEPGYAGLSYNRVKKVVFDYYSNQEAKQTEVLNSHENLANYIKYAESGGHLTVLNTNGYGYIANFLFNGTSPLTFRNGINNSTSLILPNYSISNSINVGDLYSKYKINTIAKVNSAPPYIYGSQRTKSLVVTQVVGQGQITYINIYPLISLVLNNKTLPAEVYPLLGTISKLIDSNPVKAQRAIIIPANFEDLTERNGTFEIDTNAVMFSGNRIDQLKIMDSSHKEYSVVNATNLKINGYDNASVIGKPESKLVVSSGKGLYSGLSITDPSSPIGLYLANRNNGHTSTSIAGLSNGKPFRFNNVFSVSMINRLPVYIYARQPTIHLNHASVFIKDLQFGSISGSDVKINGNVSLSIFMSDSHSFASHFYLHGSIQSSVPEFNEAKYAVPTISVEKLYSIPAFARFLSIIPILVAGIIIVYARPKKVVNNKSRK